MLIFQKLYYGIVGRKDPLIQQSYVLWMDTKDCDYYFLTMKKLKMFVFVWNIDIIIALYHYKVTTVND